jgi:hypothetical protein
MKPGDLQALTPLIYSHTDPYGTFDLNMVRLGRVRIHLLAVHENLQGALVDI